VLCWASQFAAAYEAKLSVVNAVPGIDVHGAYEQFYTPELQKMVLENAREDVESLLEKLSVKGNVFIESGNPERMIPAFVRDEKVDVLVIGRSADHGMLGRLRSHAYSLIRTSPCPVVSV
jgi:nucleotide-binding universal stress UspA family protein